MTQPLYIDATMLLRWKHLAPVGIVRLERMLCERLRFSELIGPAQYVVWDSGYRPATDVESADLDRLLRDRTLAETGSAGGEPAPGPGSPGLSGRAKTTVRRAFRGGVDRLPVGLRPFAEQAVISSATFAVETGRHVKRRAAQRRDVRSGRRVRQATQWGRSTAHRVDFSAGGDLVALGLGWEYLDHEAMYELRKRHGVRIHMPAFDLIGVDMPQFNAPQRHLVHRYYAEMAHYADSVTCISQSTLQAMSAFYAREDLTAPALFANPLPGIPPSAQMREVWPRAPFDREPFVLTVSTVEIRKNHLLLAKLWAELIREGREVPHLVLVGRVGWDADELLRWLQLAPELQDRVFLLADVDDAELLALYDRCEFTVFPSRVEGWGLPITESLMRSKVCVHSTDPAQLEASQGIMPALHPDDFMAWKGEVLRLIDDPGYRAALTERITADYVARTPDEYCAEYERILRSRIDGSGST